MNAASSPLVPNAVAALERLARRYDPIAEAKAIGPKAERAIELVANGRPWSPDILFAAARALREGDRAAGVRVPHPRLAAGLKRIAATWWVRKGKKLS